MNDLPLNVWNGLRHGSYLVVAQEVEPSLGSLRRWIAIYAICKLSKDPLVVATTYDFLRSCSGAKYCIVDFEIDGKTLAISDGISEDDLASVASCKAVSDDDLVEELRLKGVDLSRFEPDWKCDFPL